MKKKIVRKGKQDIKSGAIHWSAFDERVWGPTKLQALLDEFKQEVLTGTILSIEQFRGRKGIDPHEWQKLTKKYPFFEKGLRIIKDLIYGKRLELVYYEDKNSLMLKDLARYSEDHYAHTRRSVGDDHELRKDLAEIKIKLQTGDTDKSFEVNLYLDGKRINDPDKEG